MNACKGYEQLWFVAVGCSALRQPALQAVTAASPACAALLPWHNM